MQHLSLRIIRDEHMAVASVLRSLSMMLERGPGNDAQRYFDVLRAMLFYIDEVPERLHHPKESDLLFPKIARAQPDIMPVIKRLEADHMESEVKVRELQHLLLAWELLGDSRKQAFLDEVQPYVRSYLEHMRIEEVEVLPAAERHLSAEDWVQLDAAFAQNRDPLSQSEDRDPVWDRLFTRIVSTAPAPIGVGE